MPRNEQSLLIAFWVHFKYIQIIYERSIVYPPLSTIPTYIYEYNQKIISFTILYSAKTLNKVFCMNTNDIIRTYININFVIVAYME